MTSSPGHGTSFVEGGPGPAGHLRRQNDSRGAVRDCDGRQVDDGIIVAECLGSGRRGWGRLGPEARTRTPGPARLCPVAVVALALGGRGSASASSTGRAGTSRCRPSGLHVGGIAVVE